MIHKIEDFALWVAILDECQIYLGGDTCLLTTCETKMASHISKKKGAVNSLSCPWLLQVLTGLHTALVTTEISCPISNIVMIKFSKWCYFEENLYCMHVKLRKTTLFVWFLLILIVVLVKWIRRRLLFGVDCWPGVVRISHPGFSQLGNILHFIYTSKSHLLYTLLFFVCLFVCFSLVFIDSDGGKNRVT